MKQLIKAVLFDYNGTLFFDADINEIAWRQTINELSNNTIDFDSVYQKYKSVRNYQFVEAIFKMLNYPLNEEDILYWARRKETKYYHTYCRDHNRNKLAPGAEEFLNYLKNNNTPYNLCTASMIENINFYFDYIGLDKWFNKNIITYDDGSFNDKEEMYKTCAKNINVDIKDCLVIEDSAKSIKEAILAGARNIIAIKKDDTPSLLEIKQVINDFTEIDYKIFK